MSAGTAIGPAAARMLPPICLTLLLLLGANTAQSTGKSDPEYTCYWTSPKSAPGGTRRSDGVSHSKDSPCLVFVAVRNQLYWNFIQAKAICSTLTGGPLPIITSRWAKKDMELISSLVLRRTGLQGSTTWLSLNDAEVNGQYRWSQHANDTGVKVTKKSKLWQKGEPTGPPEYHVLLNNRNKKLIDVGASLRSAVVCQVPTALVAPLRCFQGYKLFSSGGQDFCFKVFHEKKAFHVASDYCYTHGGHLAEPRSYFADVALTQAIQASQPTGQIPSVNNGYWIAMKKEAYTGDFKWMYEGTNTGSEGYSQWKANQNIHGSRSEQRCVHKTGGRFSQWVAGPCKESRLFVCEPGVSQCPKGYQGAHYAGHYFCFHVSSSHGTYLQAVNYCYGLGGHPAEPRRYIADIALTNAIRASSNPTVNFWIGLVKGVQKGFKWVFHGTDPGAERYSQWHGSLKNIYGRRCTFKKGDEPSLAQWVSSSCASGNAHFVCEPGAPVQCREGYQGRIASDGTRFCFLLSKTKKTYNESMSHCFVNGGHLAEPRTDFANEAIVDFTRDNKISHEYWIGLKKDWKENSFNWAWMNTSIHVERYTAWQHQPPSQGHWCVHKNTGNARQTWQFGDCNAKKHFICEQDLSCPSETHWVSRTRITPCVRFLSERSTYSKSREICKVFNGLPSVLYSLYDVWFSTSLLNATNGTAMWLGVDLRKDESNTWRTTWLDPKNRGSFIVSKSIYNAFQHMTVKMTGKDDWLYYVPVNDTMRRTLKHSTLCQVEREKYPEVKLHRPNQRTCVTHSWSDFSKKSACFEYVQGSRTFEGAKKVCNNRGGTLPIIRNDMDRNFVALLVLRQTKTPRHQPTTWLNLQDADGTGVYRWPHHPDIVGLSQASISKLWQNDAQPFERQKFVQMNNNNRRLLDSDSLSRAAVVCQFSEFLPGV